VAKSDICQKFNAPCSGTGTTWAGTCEAARQRCLGVGRRRRAPLECGSQRPCGVDLGSIHPTSENGLELFRRLDDSTHTSSTTPVPRPSGQGAVDRTRRPPSLRSVAGHFRSWQPFCRSRSDANERLTSGRPKAGHI